MSNITFHRRHMTAVPTDLLLDPTISIEAKAFAGILQAIPTGNHDLQELAVLLNVPDERIVPALSELSEIGFLTIKECDGIFHLNLFNPKDMRRCTVCGARYIARSGRSKYCPDCAAEVHRKQKAAYARKRRSSVDN